MNMEVGYTITNRGMSNFTRILCYNWISEIDMIKWDETRHPLMEENCVAIFKIKYHEPLRP